MYNSITAAIKTGIKGKLFSSQEKLVISDIMDSA
jgi:hypothetical protein